MLYIFGAYLLVGFLTASIIALPYVTDYEMELEEFAIYFVAWPVLLPLILLYAICSLLEAWIKLLRKVK